MIGGNRTQCTESRTGRCTALRPAQSAARVNPQTLRGGPGAGARAAARPRNQLNAAMIGASADWMRAICAGVVMPDSSLPKCGCCTPVTMYCHR